MIKVLLVDDQAMIRSGLSRLVALADDMEVVGECEDGDELVDAVKSRRPDVVLLDVRMRRVDGVTALNELARQDEAPSVLILTTFDDDATLWDALAAGASGFVLKDASADDLLRAIRAVAAGAAWLDPAVTQRVLERHRRGTSTHGDALRLIAQLTPRELVVLKLMAQAASNAEIAEHLAIGGGTVKTHVGNIYAKLGARDRAAAIVFAHNHGLIDPP